MSARGHLSLHYRRSGERTLALDRHHGPLRVLQSLYPEGQRICHHVLVHPPGGMVGGDRLVLDVQVDAGAQALITTPGAARYYRSEGALAEQQVQLNLAEGARLEWLPLETLAYSGCQGSNRVSLALAPGAELLGWDLLSLGLPGAQQPFVAGAFEQHLHWPGVWLERGRIAADDTALLDGPVGLAGRRVVGTVWFAAGTPWGTAQREALLDSARSAVAAARAGPSPDAGPADAALIAAPTAPDERLVLLRLLAHRVESAFALMAAVRAAWRAQAWQLAAEPPRIWRS
jgi:urease accessory protein